MFLNQIRSDLRFLSNPEKIPDYQRFFKTGKGEYGEGDLFLGVTVPNTRKVAEKYSDIPLKIAEKLLKSKYHEERLLALLVLVEKFSKATKTNQSVPHARVQPLHISTRSIFNLYLKNTKYINNWDLVDLSAHKIVGAYLQDKDRKQLYKFAK